MASAPEPSSLTTLISNTGSHPISALTTQILHDLRYQHLWTSLQIHTPSKDSPSTGEQQQQHYSTPLISGIPPHRIYTHPDEQLYMLESGLRDEDILPERVFVLPTAQDQSWSLQKMAAVFDYLPDTEERPSLSGGDDEVNGSTKAVAAHLAEYYKQTDKARATKEWGGKRILLAMANRGMGGDGTIVYYIIQEGIVKPRQN
ncbi:hypothetical protein Egran_02119 [Elaphomyces granulatus]|uniref:tRNA-splicing endonuclease subunit Sen15 domain-containing protein n=1 Tax=Elaphomyces granulatus TaxID=519963 RepID=A0A232M143_9EURO|nr:hypothetical protein Egran_02119 [Elaphomyces granulatus]